MQDSGAINHTSTKMTQENTKALSCLFHYNEQVGCLCFQIGPKQFPFRPFASLVLDPVLSPFHLEAPSENQNHLLISYN